eukprot:SAG31_NODE_86_length_26973_cov_16.850897_13_plen_411_part_00
MPKHDFLSPKAIANRIKGKGLQKLRWYCQMCQKQCRDENGFKCHCESESHQRQMRLFAENQRTYIDVFSEEFESTFMDILSRRFRSSRVWCNVVYQEVISEKGHIHMNATRWETLTEFVKYLGKSGKAEVEEGITPSGQPGLFLKYIIRDAAVIAKQERLKKKETDEANEEERQHKSLSRQIEKAKAAAGEKPETHATALTRAEGGPKVTFGVTKKLNADQKAHAALSVNTAPLAKLVASSGSFSEKRGRGSGGETSTGEKRKMSALDEIMEIEKKRKLAALGSAPEIDQADKADHWLQKGIVVKVLNKKLAGGKYHKKKGVVERVVDKYVGELKMLESGHRLRLDQEMLETVIPKIGGTIKILQGSHRGFDGVVQKINEDRFSVTVGLLSQANGSVVELPYEDVSKVAA